MFDDLEKLLVCIGYHIFRHLGKLFLLFLLQLHIFLLLGYYIIPVSFIFEDLVCRTFIFYSHSNKFFLPVRDISFSVVLVKEGRNMGWQLLYIVFVIFHVEQLFKVDAVINPLRLNILFAGHNLHIWLFSISYNVSDDLVFRVEFICDCPAHSQDHEFKRLPWNFCAQVEM